VYSHPKNILNTMKYLMYIWQYQLLWTKNTKTQGRREWGEGPPFLLLATRSRCTCTKRSCLHWWPFFSPCCCLLLFSSVLCCSVLGFPYFRPTPPFCGKTMCKFLWMEFLARPARSINPHNMGSPPHWAQWFAAHQLLANSRVLGQLPHRHEVPFECVSPSSTVLASFLFRLLESFRRFLWPPVIRHSETH